MTIGVGKFGPYVRHKSAFYSLSKNDNPLTITADRAIELIEAKRKRENEKFIKEFPENKECKSSKRQMGSIYFNKQEKL